MKGYSPDFSDLGVAIRVCSFFIHEQPELLDQFFLKDEFMNVYSFLKSRRSDLIFNCKNDHF